MSCMPGRLWQHPGRGRHPAPQESETSGSRQPPLGRQPQGADWNGGAAAFGSEVGCPGTRSGRSEGAREGDERGAGAPRSEELQWIQWRSQKEEEEIVQTKWKERSCGAIQRDGARPGCPHQKEDLSVGKTRHEEEVEEFKHDRDELTFGSRRRNGGPLPRKSEDAVGIQSRARSIGLSRHSSNAEANAAGARARGLGDESRGSCRAAILQADPAAQDDSGDGPRGLEHLGGAGRAPELPVGSCRGCLGPETQGTGKHGEWLVMADVPALQDRAHGLGELGIASGGNSCGEGEQRGAEKPPTPEGKLGVQLLEGREKRPEGRQRKREDQGQRWEVQRRRQRSRSRRQSRQMNGLAEDEISEELKRVRKGMDERKPAEACEKEEMTWDTQYEPELKTTSMTMWTRTEGENDGASSLVPPPLPSEKDAEKRAALECGTFDSFVEGWVHDLSLFKLCKVKTMGNLLPFPVDSIMGHPSFSGEDRRVLQVLRGICCGLNSLYGSDPDKTLKVSAAHIKSCMFLMDEAKNFVRRCPALPALSWEDYLSVRTLDYKGDEVKVAQATSWKNAQPALPDKVGTVPLESVVTKGSLHYTLNFGTYLLPEHEQVYTKPPKIMVAEGAWEDLCKGLLASRVCGLIREADIHLVQGRRLFNGLFGVPKNDVVGGVPVHRLIMNLVPLNRICRSMNGDVSTLPAWPSMNPFELKDGETLLMSSEDVRCFFYIFTVPKEWHSYLAFGRQVPQSMWPDQEGPYYLCSQVLPMGFCNSVSLAQHIHRFIVAEAVKECVQRGGRAGWEAEHPKDRPFTWSNPSFRVYLDNFDLLEKTDSQLATTIQGTCSPFVEALREAYARHQVPRHPKKTVARAINAEIQGAEVDGETGMAAPKADKIGKYVRLCQLLLSTGVCTQRQMQVVAGGFVYFSTFRRPLLGALNHVWQFIQGFETGRYQQKIPDGVRLELSRFCLLIPLARMNFRLALSATVTASDASTTGGGVTASCGVSQVGAIAANLHVRGDITELEDVDTVLTVGLFDGIGASRVAADAVGLTVIGHVSVECHPPARRVVESRFPHTLFINSVEEVSDEVVRSWACQFSQVSVVLLGAGPPCQGVSGLNADRRGALRDHRSSLFPHVERIAKLLRTHFPWAQVHKLMESVASMDEADRVIMSQSAETTPVLVDASGLTGCRRPRLYWPTWELEDGNGASITSVTGEGWSQVTEVVLEVEFDVNIFLEPGWSKCSQQPFPTFTTSRPRLSPGRRPAGIHQCNAEEVARWQEDCHRFPPYQYRRVFCLENRRGEVRLPSVEEREVLMGFPKGYTAHCLPKGQRHGTSWMDERLSLIGNSWCVFVIAWLLHCLGVPRGLCNRLSMEDLMRQCQPGGGTRLQGYLLRPFMRVPRSSVEPQPDLLARKLTGLVSGKGEDLLLQAPSEDVQRYHRLRASIPSNLWRWKTVCGWRWSGSPDHINVLEMRAVLTALKWRFARKGWIRTRFLHLVDSQVCLHALARGRSSSRKLRRTLLRINSLLLASGAHGVWTYVHTELNPADRPSRRPVKKKWLK